MAYSSPTTRDPRARVAPAIEGRGRKQRRPSHPFNLVTKPYQIQPCAVAAVLPGETLNYAILQAQVWSDPLASGMKNVGWWCEFFLFYVKFRDLAGYDASGGIGYDLGQMMVANASLSAHVDADGNAWSYCAPGAIDWVQMATARVVDEYFRDANESWDDYLLDSVPLAKIYGRGRKDVFESLTNAADFADRRVEVPTYMSDLSDAQAEYMALRDAGLVTMDYQDWMRTYNSMSVREDEYSPTLHRPEDLAHVREFTYPTNTVEPSTGVPATAVGWRVAARLNKKFFFEEPGWLVAFNCVRPKVYLGKQQGSVAGFMQARTDWLPAVLFEHVDVGVKSFATGTGPLKATYSAAGYYLDIKDLLLNGEQFNNYATPASGNSGVPFMALPTSAGLRRYAASAEIMALFSDTTNGRFRTDGVIDFSIASHVEKPNYTSLTLGQS